MGVKEIGCLSRPEISEYSFIVHQPLKPLAGLFCNIIFFLIGYHEMFICQLSQSWQGLEIKHPKISQVIISGTLSGKVINPPHCLSVEPWLYHLPFLPTLAWNIFVDNFCANQAIKTAPILALSGISVDRRRKFVFSIFLSVIGAISVMSQSLF